MILLDIDGVCIDLMGGVAKVVEGFKPERIHSYDLEVGQYGISRAELLTQLKNRDCFERATLYNNVKEGIKKLKDIDFVCAFTCVPCNVLDIRLKQLDDLGLSGFVYTGTGNKPVMTDNVTAIIEDNPYMLDSYRDYNVHKVMIERPYNIGTPFNKFKDLLEVADYLGGIV